MATLDDKILGEKLQNYCSSSSEDEAEDLENGKRGGGGDDVEKKTIKNATFIPESKLKDNEKWNGAAQNTGPKGVIKDWQRFKQLEREKSEDGEREKRALINKLSLTCNPSDINENINKTGEKKASDLKQQQDDEQLFEDDDKFFEDYLKKTIQDMQSRLITNKKFGTIVELTIDSYLNEIDLEDKNVTIIIHIYDNRINECRTMNDCLKQLAEDYPHVKFCKVRSTEINLTDKFRKFGCPALLVYKNGELIGNFVRLTDEFGQDFYASDVENFLIEHGLLNSQVKATTIRNGNTNNASDDDD